MSSLRLFWAINLPAELKSFIRRELRAPLEHLPVNVKWVEEQNVHITLQFLGDVDSGRVDEITGAVREAAGGWGALELEIRGVGCFPAPRRPRVFWAGIGGDTEKLGQLYEKIKSTHAALGFEPGQKPFSPHLTLARFRSPENTRDFLSKASSHAPGSRSLGQFRVNTLDLMQSTLGRKGPEYQLLYSVEL